GIAAAALVLLSACTSSPPARTSPSSAVSTTLPSRHVAIHVDRPEALVDVPLHVTVTGLTPGGSVTVEAETTDAAGQAFRSEASPGGGGVLRRLLCGSGHQVSRPGHPDVRRVRGRPGRRDHRGPARVARIPHPGPGLLQGARPPLQTGADPARILRPRAPVA